MKERPIIFSGPMVRALLDGSKTQTRRVCRPQPTEFVGGPGVTLRDGSPAPLVPLDDSVEPYGREIVCPYGQPGDRLWVRESFCKIIGQSGGWIETDYQATYTHGFRLGDSLGLKKRWTPSIHMPRAASRITLEITSVRVERLQDISEADAQAEGVTDDGSLVTDLDGKDRGGTIAAYATLWEVINGVGSWDDNPWVWVVSFKRAFP
jgi:hypothetical protein